MLTLDDYFMGRELRHAGELTTELRGNATRMVELANRLLGLAGAASRVVNSGWRPRAVNAAIANASSNSRHITCQAIDINDEDGSLDAWCLSNLIALEDIGLWLEHPSATPGWCHVQIVPPRSGRRVFLP